MKRYLVYMVLLSLVEIGLALYLTEWRHTFWNYVEQRNYAGFMSQIGVFSLVALTLCFVAAYAQYFGTRAAIKWREILNTKALSIGHDTDIENHNQRVQMDCSEYPDLMIQVVFGFGKALVYIVVFAVTLSVGFSVSYLIIILLYAILSTFAARKISMPLISLNYQSQRAEATYRNELTATNFNSCIAIMLGLASKTKRLAYFQTFYGQIAVILPIVIVAPEYFSAALTLGGLMQCTSIMSTISDNASYGINSFNTINRLISCKKRLTEMGVI